MELRKKNRMDAVVSARRIDRVFGGSSDRAVGEWTMADTKSLSRLLLLV
jgi:hypothetical protein